MNDKNNLHHPHLVVIGGGSAGIGVIASIKKRIKNIKITLIEPKKEHDYQPAGHWWGPDYIPLKKPENA
ncbi:hypothetical protein [Pantoea ananatis]